MSLTPKYVVFRRTFEAAKHPKGSADRARLNCDSATSEYMPSYRYLLREVSEDKNRYQRSFRTKSEAEEMKRQYPGC